MSKFELMPHQRSGVDFLLSNNRCGLFDEPGVGKTAPAIVAAESVLMMQATTGGPQGVLVVAPKSVVVNWKREFRLWASSLTVQIVERGDCAFDEAVDVVIVPTSLIASPGIQRQIVAERWAVGIIDEAHNFRKLSARRTLALFTGEDAVVKSLERVWLLTGTWMCADPRDIYPSLRALDPKRLVVTDGEGVRRPLRFSEFAVRFCHLRPPYRHGAEERCVGVRNEDELKRRLKGFYLRRFVSELDLPALRYGTMYVDSDRHAWRKLSDEIMGELAGLSDSAFLEFMEGAEMTELRRLVGLAKAVPTALWLADVATPKDPIVVLAWHVDVITEIVTTLEGLGHRCSILTGAHSARQRDQAVREFQNGEVSFFVGQVQAAGVGITLTKSNRLVFVEKSFLPGDNAQAERRIYRKTQARPCLVQSVILNDSIDERVEEILARKRTNIAKVME